MRVVSSTAEWHDGSLHARSMYLFAILPSFAECILTAAAMAWQLYASQRPFT
jgi:hypothetical protein